MLKIGNILMHYNKIQYFLYFSESEIFHRELLERNYNVFSLIKRKHNCETACNDSYRFTCENWSRLETREVHFASFLSPSETSSGAVSFPHSLISLSQPPRLLQSTSRQCEFLSYSPTQRAQPTLANRVNSWRQSFFMIVKSRSRLTIDPCLILLIRYLDKSDIGIFVL